MGDNGRQAAPRDGKRARFLAALIACPTIREAAAAAGIGETTAWRWLAEPDFKAQFLAARAQSIAEAQTRLAGHTAAAVEALREIATDREQPAGARVSAARAILDAALKVREMDDLERRLTALEHPDQAPDGPRSTASIRQDFAARVGGIRERLNGHGSGGEA